MQAPLIVFDHTTKSVVTFATAPNQDKRLAELLKAQREQVATSGRPPRG